MRRPNSTQPGRLAAPAMEAGNETVGRMAFDPDIRRGPLSLLYFRPLECVRLASRRAHATFFASVRHYADAHTLGRPALAPAPAKVWGMARNSRYGLKNGALALGGFLAFGILAASPQPAAAQGLFGALFGGFETPAERSARYRDERLPVRAYAPSDYDHRQGGYRRDDRFPFQFGEPRSERREARPAAPSHGGSVHCVRTCDGRYFPVPRSAGGVRLDPAKVCSALCPAAETKVFHGSDMNYARAGDGERYASLDNAFAFRERIVPDCSCTGKGPGGLAQIDIESDPTLRAGDIVVTTEGPTVFTGGRQFPYQSADFTPVEDYGRLNRQLREKLAEMQVNTEVSPVVPPQRIAVTQPERPTRQAARVRTARDGAEPRRVPRQAQQAPHQYQQPRYAEPRRYQPPQRSAHQSFPFFRLW